MAMEISDSYAVLLAGGSGSRLWPVSRELYPKQLVKLIGERSLVQSTLDRLLPIVGPGRIRIVCGREHYFETARHMEQIGVPADGKILQEPCGRNTAPAVLLALIDIIEQQGDDSVLCVFPADHVIRYTDRFRQRVATAVRLARSGYVVTFGIEPAYAETGYGYIEGGEAVGEGALKIRRFVEKPDLETAEGYLRAGNFFWNSGMFAFRASVMQAEFKRHQPAMLQQMRSILSGSGAATLKGYEALEDISIDCAIMERTDRGVVLPSDFGWSDIGSWKSLYDFLPKDDCGNVVDGDVIAQNTADCVIMGRGRLIATNGLRRMVVVETPDSVFVSDLETSRDVKSIVARLKASGRMESLAHPTMHHVWGTLKTLEAGGGYRLERLVIYPGNACEIDPAGEKVRQLVVTRGRARLGAGADGGQLLEEGQTVQLDASGVSRIENPGSGALHLVQITVNAVGSAPL
jgi:mannose-1-phosphate guanylyltransferase/mannose-6-phosphate isomerase